MDAVTNKVVLWQGLGEHISDLVGGSYWEDLDEPLLHMFTEVMVADVDVLGAGAQLGKPCQFQCTCIVLKDLAIDVGLGADDWNVLVLHFLN